MLKTESEFDKSFSTVSVYESSGVSEILTTASDKVPSELSYTPGRLTVV